ncbi:MAG: TlpA disulfide reductase family protein [Bryobacteraceae bacterium]|jgi:thiol-disulfide isomerase/thioredoxin
MSFAAWGEGPRLSPPLTVQRAGAAPLTLASFRGKIVALAFIFTTCPHCQDLTRELVPIAREYQPRGVQFLECAFDDEAPASLAGFVEQFRPPFPVGYTNRAAVDSYLGRTIIDLRPLYMPHLVFLDRKGFIQGDFPGESDFMLHPAANVRAELDRLLSVRPAEPKESSGNADAAGKGRPAAPDATRPLHP